MNYTIMSQLASYYQINRLFCKVFNDHRQVIICVWQPTPKEKVPAIRWSYVSDVSNTSLFLYTDSILILRLTLGTQKGGACVAGSHAIFAPHHPRTFSSTGVTLRHVTAIKMHQPVPASVSTPNNASPARRLTLFFASHPCAAACLPMSVHLCDNYLYSARWR